MSKVILPKTTTAVRKEAIPAEGEVLFDKDEKQIFFGDGSTQGGIPLRKHSMQTAYVYGLDYDTTTNTTTGTKVVLNHDHDVQDDPLRYLAVAEFTQTPAHAFKSCLMDMATKQIKCFLDISDSTKKEDGTPLTEKEKKGIWTENGVDSLVEFMVRIPITWYREDTYHVTVSGVDHLHIVYLVSNEEFVGSAPHPWFYTSNGGETASVQYIGKFPSVLCNSSGVPYEQTADETVVASHTGDLLRSIMGYRPATNINRNVCRTLAGNNHGQQPNALFGWWKVLMMAIDCGNFNVQPTSNAQDSGFISYGFANMSTWYYSTLRRTGRSAIFGNQTGSVYADEDVSTITISNKVYTRDLTADSGAAKAWVAEDLSVVYTKLELPYLNTKAYTDTSFTTETAANITNITGWDYDILHMKGGATNWRNNDHYCHVVSFSWRGIEDPYGARWEYEDGCQKNQKADADTCVVNDITYTRYPSGNVGSTAYAWKPEVGDLIYFKTQSPAVGTQAYNNSDVAAGHEAGLATAVTENYDYSGIWVTNDTSKYSECGSDMGYGATGEKFPSRGYTGASYAWINHPWPKREGYIKTFDPLTFYCIEVGGAWNTYFGDYFYNNAKASPCVLYVGGGSSYTTYGGAGSVYVISGLSFTGTHSGSRLAASQN